MIIEESEEGWLLRAPSKLETTDSRSAMAPSVSPAAARSSAASLQFSGGACDSSIASSFFHPKLCSIFILVLGSVLSSFLQLLRNRLSELHYAQKQGK